MLWQMYVQLLTLFTRETAQLNQLEVLLKLEKLTTDGCATKCFFHSIKVRYNAIKCFVNHSGRNDNGFSRQTPNYHLKIQQGKEKDH